MVIGTLSLDLREIGLPYLLANAAVEIGNRIRGKNESINSVFMTGELLHELSHDEERLANIDYVFREPLERCYGKKWGKEIKTTSDLRRTLEAISCDFRNFRNLPRGQKEKLEFFCLRLYRRMIYYQEIEGEEYLTRN